MNENVLARRNQIVWSQEMLTHFQCLHCDGWWSIADYDARIARMHAAPTYLHCPWCGIAQRSDELEERPND